MRRNKALRRRRNPRYESAPRSNSMTPAVELWVRVPAEASPHTESLDLAASFVLFPDYARTPAQSDLGVEASDAASGCRPLGGPAASSLIKYFRVYETAE